MIIKLYGHGNPDYQQYSKVAPTKRVKVFNLTEAKRVCQEYIDMFQLGAGNFECKVFIGKKQVGEISYNLRIWDMNEREINPVLGFLFSRDFK